MDQHHVLVIRASIKQIHFLVYLISDRVLLFLFPLAFAGCELDLNGSEQCALIDAAHHPFIGLHNLFIHQCIVAVRLVPPPEQLALRKGSLDEGIGHWERQQYRHRGIVLHVYAQVLELLAVLEVIRDVRAHVQDMRDSQVLKHCPILGMDVIA